MIREIYLANPQNYGGKRNAGAIRWIVVHYTGNDGDRAQSNASYFRGKVTKTSAHWFVDDEKAIMTVPELNDAYAVGDSRYKDYKQTGGASYYGLCNNHNSISVEMCDTSKDGRIYPTEKTLQNTAELIAELMQIYHVDINHVIRHFDVSGKACPAYFASRSNKDWLDFRDRIKGEQEVEKSIEIKLNGVYKTVHAIEKGGNNYVKLQDLRDDKIAIEYAGCPVVRVVDNGK